MNFAISDLAVVVIVSAGVFLGMYAFMEDLAYYGDGSTKYNITPPIQSHGNITGIFTDLEDKTTGLEETLTGSESWSETAYNIIFNFPRDIISTLSGLADAGGKLLGVFVGDESAIPTPSWVRTMVILLISVVIVFSIVYLVLGRRV